MAEPPRHQITELLRRWSDGDKEAMDELMPMVYEQLRKQASRYLDRENPGHTLDTGALIHETYLKLNAIDQVEFHSRVHFYAIAARTMRRILVDHARAHKARKRGGGKPVLPLNEALLAGEQPSTDVLSLNLALDELAELDPLKAKLVELRFFGGLTHEEIATVLKVSVSTVERQWRLARAWLYCALQA